MGTAFAVQATIARPCAEVWSTLTDWERAPTWMSGVDQMSADGPTQAGTQLTFHARGQDRPAEIAACEPGRSVVVRSVQGGVTADYTYEVEPLDPESTRVKLTAECVTKGALWTLASPLLRFAMKMTDRKQLEDLRVMIESG